MNDQAMNLLRRLLSACAPSGYETAAARVWYEAAQQIADAVSVDLHCNSYAFLHGGQPRLLLTAHIDEIGLMLSFIDETGYLAFSTIGRWDPQVLVGQRVRLQGRQGEVPGVIGRPAVHLLKPDQAQRASSVEELWIDIGARSRAEAHALVGIGTIGVLDGAPQYLPNRRLVARAIDNRVGAFVVLEVLRALADQRPAATVVAAATSQEEISLAGAAVAAQHVQPDIAIVVDMTFAADHPGVDRHQLGEAGLGCGPVLACGSANHPALYDLLLRTAAQAGIPYSIQITPSYTGTEADVLQRAASGVATAVVSIPCRYMHSPNEMVALDDIEWTVQLLAAFAQALSTEIKLRPSFA